jgi:accessory gene regulator B
MLRFIAEEITLYLIANKIIKIENRSFYIYGIELFINNLFITATIAIIALVSKTILLSLIFATTFYFLRAYSGGYHCKKYIQCYFFSISIYISLILANAYIGNYKSMISIVLLCASLPIIVIHSPVEHKNNPLTIKEKSKYRKISITLLTAFSIMDTVFLILKQQDFSLATSWAISASAVLILLSKKEDIKHEEKMS